MSSTDSKTAAGSSVRTILDSFMNYQAARPGARIHAYRKNPGAIRLRIIDPGFEGLDRAQRQQQIWDVLLQLPEQVQAEINVLLLLTPEESEDSFANMDFEKSSLTGP